MGKHYLYRHIRLDKKEPFYIGIGTKHHNSCNTYESEYHRAFVKNNKRTKFWRNITNKTTYEVEILLESDNLYFIKEKETEFIKLYGRIDNNTGTLCNLTDGGEGTIGYKFSEEVREKLRKSSFMKGRRGIDHPSSKKIYQYNLQGSFVKEWSSIAEVAELINVNKSTIQKIAKHAVNNNYCKGSYWTLNKCTTIEPKSFRLVTFAKIEMLDPISNMVISVFDSKEDALRFLGKRKSGT